MRKLNIKPNRLFVISLSAALLSACTPPMPPDVLAAVAEQEVICAKGEINIALEEFNTPVVQSILDLYLSSCTELTANLVTDATTAEIVISDGATEGVAICANPISKVPVMVESTGIAFNLSGVSSLVLDASTLDNIYKRQITDWADPAIVALNPEFELTSTPIKILSLLKPTASDKTFYEWMNRLGANNFSNASTSEFATSLELVEALAATDGAIAIIPGSIMSDNALSGISLQTEDGVVAYDLTSITSASSQSNAVTEGENVTVSLDPTKEVLAEAGSDALTLPWQGISWVYLAICKSDSIDFNSEAMARFFLRQDAQGQLSVYGYGSLEEGLRLTSAGIVGKNLPLPSDVPASE